MKLTVSEHHLGTSEAAWEACPRLAATPERACTPARRVLVVAPHPDDEVLGVGGILHGLAQAGCAITIVAVTDGEASHPNAAHIAPADLASWRDAERAEALARLAVDASVVRLVIADGCVTAAESSLRTQLESLLANADLCLAPWQHDGHPDHDASGRAAMAACSSRHVRLLQYPVWAWHWARPASTDLPWSRAQRVPLAKAAQAAKRSAIAAYRTQIIALGPSAGEQAILPEPVLARFHRPFEVVFA